MVTEHPGSNMVLIRCIVLIIRWMAPALTRTGLNLLVAVATLNVNGTSGVSACAPLMNTSCKAILLTIHDQSPLICTPADTLACLGMLM